MKIIKIILKIVTYFFIGLSLYYLIEKDLAPCFICLFVVGWLLLLKQQGTYEETWWSKKGFESEKEAIRTQILDAIFAKQQLGDCPDYQKWSRENRNWAEMTYEKYKTEIERSNIED